MAALPSNKTGGWVTRRHPPRKTPIQLRRQRLYILPNGYGYVFALMLLVLFLWSINYNNSMGFAFTFLLGAVALNGMWRSHVNLLQLRIHPGHADPVFTGQQAHFRFRLENSDPRPRYAIGLQRGNDAPVYGDVPGNGTADIIVAVPTIRRGPMRAGRLRVLTHFPLGLFRVWSWLEFEQHCLVYPKPLGRQPLPSHAAGSTGTGTVENTQGNDDFDGLRGYHPGDSPRHIAWKASAREGDLLVKLFSAQSSTELWLDWYTIAADGTEARLSQLCQWVLKADGEGRDYGLRLPGLELPPARGANHRYRCLEALALFDHPEVTEHGHSQG